MEISEYRSLPAPDKLGVLSPVWSPDGSTIAVAATDGSFIRPAVIDVASGKMRVLIERNLPFPGTRTFFQWLDNSTLACELTGKNRPTLWLDLEKRGAVASAKAWEKAWAGREPTASRLTSDQPAAEFETIELCSLNVETGQYEIFSRDSDLPARMESFRDRPEREFPPRCVGFGKIVPPESVLVASHPETDQSIYLVRSDDATRVIRLTAGEASTVFETDTHMGEVIPSRTQVLPFKTSAGQDAKLRCILPPDYKEGERRPAVLWVYPGFTVGDDLAHRQHLINEPGCFNLHLLAAHGFVVIIPSMPVEDERRGGRELADCLMDSALPACEAAIDAGYVDRKHVHVAGHSLGGWAALMLLTKTPFFRSGIAMAGTSNLLSLTDDVRFRYDSIPDDSRQAGTAENYYLTEPPWRTPDRYIRNSPLFSVENISAPVLMLHGDQDYVEIGQSEQMFAALRLLGRKAELVRYWGEAHVFESPANIEDAWRRILRWLEQSSPALSL